MSDNQKIAHEIIYKHCMDCQVAHLGSPLPIGFRIRCDKCSFILRLICNDCIPLRNLTPWMLHEHLPLRSAAKKSYERQRNTIL